ncbi:hypothetical protein R1sor_008793 [Riccia sorocarpa]|uniref:Uncharacterized protein n=1 Tax=Riccia sorocarpa TaxID=122646 RepID=A0ABD3HXZ8_9MARC
MEGEGDNRRGKEQLISAMKNVSLQKTDAGTESEVRGIKTAGPNEDEAEGKEEFQLLVDKYRNAGSKIEMGSRRRPTAPHENSSKEITSPRAVESKTRGRPIIDLSLKALDEEDTSLLCKGELGPMSRLQITDKPRADPVLQMEQNGRKSGENSVQTPSWLLEPLSSETSSLEVGTTNLPIGGVKGPMPRRKKREGIKTVKPRPTHRRLYKPSQKELRTSQVIHLSADTIEQGP